MQLRSELAGPTVYPGNVSSTIYAMYQTAVGERRRKLERLEREEAVYQEGYQDGLKQALHSMEEEKGGA